MRSSRLRLHAFIIGTLTIAEYFPYTLGFCFLLLAENYLEAGTGFEPVMLRAYETAVVTTLPAVYSGGCPWNRTKYTPESDGFTIR